MIVPMKKVSVLLYHTESEAFLKALQDLGVVHLVQEQDKDQTSLHETEQRIRRCEDALAFLNRFAPARTAAGPQRRDRGADEVLEELERLEALHAEHERELHELRRIEEALAPWGDFDPKTVKRLRDAGMAVRFYAGDEKTYAAAAAAGLLVVPVARHQAGLLFFVCGTGDAAVGENTEEIALPEQSLSDVRRGLKRAQEDLVRVEAEIRACAAYRALLHGARVEQKNRLRFLSAMLDLKPCVGGRILAVTGWFPAAREKEIARFLHTYQAWFCCDDPGPDDDVPVLLHNGPFARLFEPITRLFSLPDYREYDPTPFFAPFFALYVGLCIGDVGYGALLTAASCVALRKLRSPRYRPYCIMMLIFGCTTMAGGMLLNTCFGATLFGGPEIPGGRALFGSGARFFAPLSPVTGRNGITYPMMHFALLLGFLQVLLALVLRVCNNVRERGMVFGLQPLAYIFCLCGGLVWAAHGNFMKLDIAAFTVGPARIGAMLAAVPAGIGIALFWCGMALLLLFNNPDTKLRVRLPLGLWELYGFATGILGDILSYMRLFALGLSSGLLGASFNKLAFMAATKAGVVQYVSPLFIVTIALLVLGHGLNLILSMVGAFVHPLRLTFVEFYKNLGFKGGGKAYEPLAKME